MRGGEEEKEWHGGRFDVTHLLRFECAYDIPPRSSPRSPSFHRSIPIYTYPPGDRIDAFDNENW